MVRTTPIGKPQWTAPRIPESRRECGPLSRAHGHRDRATAGRDVVDQKRRHEIEQQRGDELVDVGIGAGKRREQDPYRPAEGAGEEHGRQHHGGGPLMNTPTAVAAKAPARTGLRSRCSRCRSSGHRHRKTSQDQRGIQKPEVLESEARAEGRADHPIGQRDRMVAGRDKPRPAPTSARTMAPTRAPNATLGCAVGNRWKRTAIVRSPPLRAKPTVPAGHPSAARPGGRGRRRVEDAHDFAVERSGCGRRGEKLLELL